MPSRTGRDATSGAPHDVPVVEDRGAGLLPRHLEAPELVVADLGQRLAHPPVVDLHARIARVQRNHALADQLDQLRQTAEAGSGEDPGLETDLDPAPLAPRDDALDDRADLGPAAPAL